MTFTSSRNKVIKKSSKRSNQLSEKYKKLTVFSKGIMNSTQVVKRLGFEGGEAVGTVLVALERNSMR